MKSTPPGGWNQKNNLGLNNKSDTAVLISPLDWGLGHATRCLPIIRYFSSGGYRVVIAASGKSAQFLKDTCPNEIHTDIPGPEIRYPLRGWHMPFWLMVMVPKLIRWYFSDRIEAERLARHHHISLIISDNRYGFYSSRCPSILITHQLHIQPPLWLSYRFPRISKLGARLIYPCFQMLFLPFRHIWVPDVSDAPSLSGCLSHGEPLPRKTIYIGPLSRFSQTRQTSEIAESKIDLLVLISGPEPHRTLFEQIVKQSLSQTQLRCVILLGKPPYDATVRPNGPIRYYNHLGEEQMARAIRQADVILCRSGYTTLMELSGFQKQHIVLLPTPGQTEQEYLARYLADLRMVHQIPQAPFDPSSCMAKAKELRGFSGFQSHSSNFSELVSGLLPQNITSARC